MKTILEKLEQFAIETPSKTLYTLLGKNCEVTEELSFAETYHKSRAIAAALTGRHMAGERCILMYEPGLDVTAAFFGCLYAGVIAVPAFPLKKNASSSRIAGIINDAQAKVICTTKKVYNSISKLFDEYPVLQGMQWIYTDEIAATDVPFVPQQFKADDIAYLQYTSGSTGEPKGTIITHGNIVSNLEAIDETCRHHADSRIFSWMPVYHDMGLIYGVLQAVYNGCTSYLMSPMTVMQEPYEWLHAISKYGIHYSTGPNFAYELCLKRITAEQKRTLDLDSWIAAGCAAEPIRPETLRKFAVAFRSCGFSEKAFAPCYGLAEATLKVTGVAMDKEVMYLDVDATALENNIIITGSNGSRNTELVGCGMPAFNTVVKIVDPETLEETTGDTIGEIWVQSPSVAAGFWNKPEESQAQCRAAIKNGAEGFFLRTGDLGFIHNGELFVTGRIKELIIIRGTNHYPQDIEHSIRNSHPALNPCEGAAFSVTVDGAEELVVVYEINNALVTGDSGTETAQEIVRAIRDKVFRDHDISIYDVVFIRTNTLPKTSSGKIQRTRCREDYLQNGLKHVLYTAGEKPLSIISEADASVHVEKKQTEKLPGYENSSIEEWLVANLSDVLHVPADEIENDEPFAAYGLDSSIAAWLTGKINEHFDIEIEPTVFWEYSTINALAGYIERIRNEVGIN